MMSHRRTQHTKGQLLESPMHTKASVTPSVRSATSTNIMSAVKHRMFDCLGHCKRSRQRNTFEQKHLKACHTLQVAARSSMSFSWRSNERLPSTLKPHP